MVNLWIVAVAGSIFYTYIFQRSLMALLTSYRTKIMKHEKGELRFQCVTCTARFRCRSSLNRHMLTHLKPYKCDRCEEKFKTPKKLARHIGRLSKI